MMRLLGVELTRLRTRRLVWLLVLLAVLATALVAAKSAWDTRPLTQEEITTARAQADLEAAAPQVAPDVEQCIKAPAEYLGPGATAADCREALGTPPQRFLPRQPLDLGGTLSGNGLGLAVLLSGIMVLVGAGFAGRDWASGAIRTQLVVEPSRTRVWVAKALAVWIATAVVTAVLLAAFWGALHAVAVDRGLRPTAAVTHDILWQSLRTVALAAFGALGGYALAMWLRSGVTTVLLLFALTIGGEVLITVLPVDGIARWSVLNNVFGWLAKHMEFYDPATACLGLTDCGPGYLSHASTGLLLAGLTLAATVVSVIAFRRRDL